MATTVALRNCGLRKLHHPQFGGMAAVPTVSKSKVFKQVNADVYSTRYAYLAKFGVHVTAGGTSAAGSAVVTGTGNVGTTNQMIVVDMTADMTLTLPALADVPADWNITIYLRARSAGTLTVVGAVIDEATNETILTVDSPTYTAVGSILRIKKGTSATDWEAQTI